jgi:hypothetical protein
MSFTFDDEPVYKIGDSFTMRNILNIVDKMNAAMPHYEFEPEPVCEGGIRVKQEFSYCYHKLSAPRRVHLKPRGYKTFRLNFDNWPYFGRHGVKTEDLDTKLVAYDFTGKGKMYTRFKTLHDAPEWTKEEVECVDTIVRGEGMKRVRA